MDNNNNNNNIAINNIYCIAFKKNKPHEQCTNKRRINSDYCGIHFKNNILTPSKQEITDIIKKSKEYKLFHYRPFLKYNYVIYRNLVDHCNETIIRSVVNINKIIKIQRLFKKYMNKLIPVLHGPGWKNTSLCNNTTDFYSLDELATIPDNLFFSFRDENDGLIYGFHIESFINYIETNINQDNDELLNPYNRNKINESIRTLAFRLWRHLHYRHLESHEIQLYEESEDNETRCRSKTVRYFQKLDMLGYQTNIDWILNANMKALKGIYINLLHYWLFKAGLDINTRNVIVPFIDIFPDEDILALRDSIDRFEVMELVLTVINNLVSSADKDDDRRTGSILVLMAMSEIIPDVIQYNPWLV
jgi:hypothetical protein